MKKLTFMLVLLTIASLLLGNKYYNEKLAYSSKVASAEYKKGIKQEQITREKEINLLINSLGEIELENYDSSRLNNPLKQNLISGKRFSILFLGDSTTEQNQYTNGKDGHVNIIKKTLTNLPGVDLTIINAGVSGDDTSLMLKRLDQEVINNQPDLIVFSSGINDAVNLSNDQFSNNFEKIIEKLKKETDSKIIFRTSNPAKDITINDKLQNKINPRAKELAEKYDIGYVDLYSYFESTTGDKVDEYMKDGYHPNEKGQKLISDFLLKVLLVSE